MGYNYHCAVAIKKLDLKSLNISDEDIKKIETFLYKGNLDIGIQIVRGFIKDLPEDKLDYYDLYIEGLIELSNLFPLANWKESSDKQVLGRVFTARRETVNQLKHIFYEYFFYEQSHDYGYIFIGEEPGDEDYDGDLVDEYVFLNTYASFDE